MKLKTPTELTCPKCAKPFEPLGFGHREGCPVGRGYKLPHLVTTGHLVLVFGSRIIELQQYGRGVALLDQQLATNPDMVVLHGGAKGGDHLAREWAELSGVATEVWYPQWGLLGGWLAPLWRNAEMAARKPREAVGLIGPCVKPGHAKRPPHPSHSSVDMALRLRALGIPVIPHCWGFPGDLEDFLATKVAG